eukprot:COSAG06_NODE_3002_length_5972_cov_2.141325_3_plen_101_part_00
MFSHLPLQHVPRGVVGEQRREEVVIVAYGNEIYIHLYIYMYIYNRTSVFSQQVFLNNGCFYSLSRACLGKIKMIVSQNKRKDPPKKAFWVETHHSPPPSA